MLTIHLNRSCSLIPRCIEELGSLQLQAVVDVELPHECLLYACSVIVYFSDATGSDPCGCVEFLSGVL